MITFTTASGSTYEVDEAQSRMRRIEGSHVLRRDGTWITYFSFSGAVVGEGAVFALEPLGVGDVTMRPTTPVVSVVRGS